MSCGDSRSPARGVVPPPAAPPPPRPRTRNTIPTITAATTINKSTASQPPPPIPPQPFIMAMHHPSAPSRSGPRMAYAHLAGSHSDAGGRSVHRVVGSERIQPLSLIHLSEPTRLGMCSYAVFCLLQ